MKLKTADLLQIINDDLASIGASLRIIDYCVDLCLLNSGLILGRYGFIQLRSRLASKWYRHRIDELYANDLVEGLALAKILRSQACSVGGKSLMEKHGSKVIERATQNLAEARRTGTCWTKPNPWMRGKNKNNCEQLMQLSESRKGAGNPAWGRSPSEHSRQLQSMTMKKLIIEGKFTPNVRNSRTRRTSKWNGKSYRSSWEAAFASLHPTFAYEEIRISYVFDNKISIYIVDFVDYEARNLIEIKPRSQISSPRIQSKHAAAEAWCAENGFQFSIITENELFLRWSGIHFDELDVDSITSLRKAYETYTKKRYRNAK